MLRRLPTVVLLCLLTLGPGLVPEAEARGPSLLGRLSMILNPFGRHARQARQIRSNARNGDRRERVVGLSTRLTHPFSSVQAERYLLDGRGNRIIDPVTGEARRFDFAVIGPFGRVSELIEVTSTRASKSEQEAKTARILRRKHVYVRDLRDGSLREVKPRGLLFRTRVRTVRLR